MKAMILAAGLGTRLKPFTDTRPKALVEVNGKSLLQRNVEYLCTFHIRDIVINVHHFAGLIIETIKKSGGWGAKISISDETDEVLETGGGLKKASWFFKDSGDPFVLMNVDVLTDLDLDAMIALHRESGALATLAVSERPTSRYFLFDSDNRLCGWENTTTGEKRMVRNGKGITRKAFSGIHVLSPGIFQYIQQEGKFSIVDVYLSLAHDHRIMAFDQGDCRFADVGRPESILLAEKMFE